MFFIFAPATNQCDPLHFISSLPRWPSLSLSFAFHLRALGILADATITLLSPSRLGQKWGALANAGKPDTSSPQPPNLALQYFKAPLIKESAVQAAFHLHADVMVTHHDVTIGASCFGRGSQMHELGETFFAVSLPINHQSVPTYRPGCCEWAATWRTCPACAFPKHTQGIRSPAYGALSDILLPLATCS